MTCSRNQIQTKTSLSAEHPALMPIFVASTKLVVRNLAVVRTWYETVLGLVATREGGNEVGLGTETCELLTLVGDPSAELAADGTAGLFHNAFLLPDRQELSDWFAHAASLRTRIDGASDHGVSEAIYLNDPEGNGIEVYADRTRSDWKTTLNGSVALPTKPLDLDGLFQRARSAKRYQIANDARIGHIHLSVGSVSQAQRFFVDGLGFDIRNEMAGAHFYGSGGYHHHVAVNTWNTRAGPRPDGRYTGLQEYTLYVRNDRDLDVITQDLETGGFDVERSEKSVQTRDPWGITACIEVA